MAADLHIHTTFSDGTQTPEEVIREAKAAGLSTISITDHDVVGGIDPAALEGAQVDVRVIPGLEFTTETKEAEIHILGYFIDHHSDKLLAILSKIQESRTARIFKMVDKLKSIGIDLEPEKILALSANKGSVGRPHVARAMVEAGIVSNIREAFQKYIGSDGPAYVPHFKLTPEEAIKLVIESSGIPVYAHPATSNRDDMIPELMSYGLKGIEAYYGGHSASNVRRYLSLAKKHGLLVTGGSDYHGAQSAREIRLGDVRLPDELVDKLESFRVEAL
jgi:hypothetical protein